MIYYVLTFAAGFILGWLHRMGFMSELKWARTKEAWGRRSYKPVMPAQIKYENPPKPLPPRPQQQRLQRKRDYLDSFLKTHGTISPIELIHFIEAWESL